MKRDGRKLDHKTLEEIRRMAVERVWEGEDPSEVIASYGICRTTIYKWLRAAKGKGRGLDALRSRKGTGRPAKLTKSQQRRVFRWINGKDPRQYGFDFGLWTRKVVAELISDKFAIELSLASGRLAYPCCEQPDVRCRLPCPLENVHEHHHRIRPYHPVPHYRRCGTGQRLRRQGILAAAGSVTLLSASDTKWARSRYCGPHSPTNRNSRPTHSTENFHAHHPVRAPDPGDLRLRRGTCCGAD